MRLRPDQRKTVQTIATEAVDPIRPSRELEQKLQRLTTQFNAKLEWAPVPASASATGTAGQVAYESGWFYICVATDTWERVAIATWV